MEKSPNNSKGTQTLQQNRRALVEKIIKNMDQGYVPLQRRWASFGRPFNPVSHCNYKRLLPTARDIRITVGALISKQKNKVGISGKAKKGHYWKNGSLKRKN